MEKQSPVPVPAPSSQWGQYFTSSQSFVRVPENQFAHAVYLLSSRGRNITQMSDYTEILDPNSILGFIDNDNLLRFYQNDLYYIHNFFAMGKKSDALFEIFQIIHNVWKAEIRITANKGGIERRLQHSFGGGISAEGFGKMLQELEKKRQADDYERQKQQQGGGLYA